MLWWTLRWWGTSYCMLTVAGAAKERLLVFNMLFNFILTAQLSLLVLGHNNDSTDGSNIRYGVLVHSTRTTDWQSFSPDDQDCQGPSNVFFDVVRDGDCDTRCTSRWGPLQVVCSSEVCRRTGACRDGVRSKLGMTLQEQTGQRWSSRKRRVVCM